MVSSHAESGSGSTLFMTCQMFVNAPDGTRITTHGLVDSCSSTPRSYLNDCLNLQHIRISGITGMSRGSPLQSVATFSISPLLLSSERLLISAIVVPKVTCDLPTQPVILLTQDGIISRTYTLLTPTMVNLTRLIYSWE